MTICASKDAVLALDNVNMTMDATGSTGSPMRFTSVATIS